MYIILEKNIEIAKSFDPVTSLLLSSVDIERLEVLFKSVASSDHVSPAGRTILETGSADSTHKVPLAALVDLGLSPELIKTNLKKYFD